VRDGSSDRRVFPYQTFRPLRKTIVKVFLIRRGEHMSPLFGIFGLGPTEIIFLLGLGVLLFGRKLPEVGRYLGKGIVEFKKGIKGLEDEVESTQHRPEPTVEPPRPPQRVTTTAPKFEDNAGTITTPPHA
jgi:sec-independent protein translocase protein TatA